MKKTLLLLALLAVAGGVRAQMAPNMGPWVEVNTNTAAFAPGYSISYVHTVAPNVAWLVARERTMGSTPQFVFVTNNAAGDQFSFDAISAGSTDFQTANVFGLSSTVALAATHGPNGGGEILRTTNGGVSWTKVTTPTQFQQSRGGFLNMVHMFDANVGVAVGDPTGGSFEILRTTDGGLTWTRVPAANIPPLLNSREFGLVHSMFARGNTMWFGGASSSATDPVRVFKTTDRGLTWTASPVTTLTESISRLAFKDDLNGIAYNQKLNAAGDDVAEVNVIRTSDGGATWSPITPINTRTGSFFRFDIDAVNGRYYSVGLRFPSANPLVAEDLGSSFSTDGINWTNLNDSQGFFAFDLIDTPITSAITGYAGAVTDANGAGGIYKANSIAVTATRDAALQSALQAYPNPSQTGVFKVNLGSALKGNAHLTVVDALGRQVRSQALNASAVGSKEINLDLSTQKTGVYTLQIRTDAGIATLKLVIN
jgi:photosystem II stability/assembly factor-like uncharacterized protein